MTALDRGPRGAKTPGPCLGTNHSVPGAAGAGPSLDHAALYEEAGAIGPSTQGYSVEEREAPAACHPRGRGAEASSPGLERADPALQMGEGTPGPTRNPQLRWSKACPLRSLPNLSPVHPLSRWVSLSEPVSSPVKWGWLSVCFSEVS